MYYLLALVTLFVIVILVIFIVRIIILTIRYMKWRKISVPAIGIVGELKNVSCNCDRNDEITSCRYDYTLKIVHGNQEFNDIYSEVCKPGNTPNAHPGKEIHILWSASDHTYLQIAKTGDEIWQVVKKECAFILHVALLIFGNRRYFRDHHRKCR